MHFPGTLSRRCFRLLPILLAIVIPVTNVCGDDLPGRALNTAKHATRFLTERVATSGGYLWSYSGDLQLREGEGVVDTATVWVQPPGTPAVGEAFVRLYEATGDPQFLRAARQAADALRRGQMRSGGWQDRIEFEPKRRKKWAYRIDKARSRQKDQSSLDDDKTQSALRFLIQLDRATGMSDPVIHEMVMTGLRGMIEQGQFRNGGFPQVWMDRRSPDADAEPRPASYPDDWPRSYPGHGEYWSRYTLNDFLAGDVMEVLFLAADVYDQPPYRAAAIELADSLLLAQLPDPQPAWAQQYNASMEPIWARKFEPPAITTSESFGVLDTLLDVYLETGDRKYLEPIPRALDYLKTCELPDEPAGRVARFYELRTNRPLYFDRQYHLTYRDDDLPTHYAFQLNSQVDRLRRRYEQVARQPPVQPSRRREVGRRPSDDAIRKIITAADDRGIWVSNVPLRYHDHPGPTIEMRAVVDRLNRLADFLQASQRDAETGDGGAAKGSPHQEGN